jgi:hypothetical protein
MSFQSDNGGPHSAKFTGEVDMSKSTIPADNGLFRDGKASLDECGTRVAALVNWPGHERNPQKVAELQQRIQELSREAVPPLIFNEAMGAVKPALFGAVTFPDQESSATQP